MPKPTFSRKRTDIITITSKVRTCDYETIRFARAAAKSIGISDCDIIRRAYADVLRQARAKLESSGRWDSFAAEYAQNRAQSTPKASTNPPTTAPNPRPPQVFEG
jgi:hypothetical protein